MHLTVIELSGKLAQCACPLERGVRLHYFNLPDASRGAGRFTVTSKECGYENLLGASKTAVLNCSDTNCPTSRASWLSWRHRRQARGHDGTGLIDRHVQLDRHVHSRPVQLLAEDVPRLEVWHPCDVRGLTWFCLNHLRWRRANRGVRGWKRLSDFCTAAHQGCDETEVD